jgi:hypothetical protein
MVLIEEGAVEKVSFLSPSFEIVNRERIKEDNSFRQVQ